MPKKKKTNKGGQQFLSPEKFMQTRARNFANWEMLSRFSFI